MEAGILIQFQNIQINTQSATRDQSLTRKASACCRLGVEIESQLNTATKLKTLKWCLQLPVRIGTLLKLKSK